MKQENRFNGINGNGYQPINKEQIIEEWFCSLPTEDKAKFLIKAMMLYSMTKTLSMSMALEKARQFDGKINDFLIVEVLEWLKGKCE